MTTDASAAAILFGDGAPEPASAVPPTPTFDQKAAATLYAPEPDPKPAEDVPLEVAHLRESDPERKFFGAQSTHGDVPLEQAFAEVEGMTDEQRATAAHEWREIAVDVGVSPPDARHMLSEFQHALANPPTAETRAAWRTEADRRLSERFGADAPKVLADARRLVQRDPRVVQLLIRSGLGDSPDMVLRAAELAQRQRAAGKLK